MAKDKFNLPVSPLLGSTLRVFRKTLKGNLIERQFKMKKNMTLAIVYLLSPLRWYEQLFVLPRARKKKSKEIVFIVGHWRGGTTFLHNLMCQAKNASFVTTYQTVFPNFIGSKRLLGPLLNVIMPHKRPSDNVKLNVDFPQEEEFALGGVNPFSYYRCLYFPKKYERHYEESTRLEHLSEDEKCEFKQDYKDLIHKALLNKPEDLLIIKNPINTARIELLNELYPNAKWIHLYRDPYIVYQSTRKFFSQLMPTLWFNEVSEEFIEDFILKTYVKLYKDYDKAVQNIPDLNLVEVKFEEFETDPIGNLASIYQRLGISGFETSRPQFENYLNSQKSYKKNKYELPNELIELVDAHWGEYIKRWGYSKSGD